MSTEKPRRLGRGLEALLASRPTPHRPPSDDDTGFVRARIADIRPNPYQPRREFREAELAQLEASLEATGLLQPITLRRAPSGSGFELIAGERRLRAATRLGWTEIPAVVSDIDDRTLLTLALVENLQRADLNALEEAEGYERLMAEFSVSQQQVADAVGKDRSTVSNALRLLQLPESIRRLIREGRLTAGHARALLGAADEARMAALAAEAVSAGLSVREVEARVRPRPLEERADAPGGSRVERRGGGRGERGAEDPALRRAGDALRRKLQTDVVVTANAAGRGHIQLAFYSPDDLERLLDLLAGPDRHDS